MFLANLRAYPDDHRRIKTCRIGEQLAQMSVIGRLQLVFDNDLPVAADIARTDIGSEAADGAFRPLQFKIEAQRLTQTVEVFRQPRRESALLGCPYYPCIEIFDFAQFNGGSDRHELSEQVEFALDPFGVPVSAVANAPEARFPMAPHAHQA